MTAAADPQDYASVLVAAAHAAIRSALRQVIEPEPGIVAVGTTSDLNTTIRLLRRTAPDAVVIHAGLLDVRGVGRLPMLASAAPDTAFIVVGMGDHPGFAARARAAGAAEYVRLDQASERLGPAVLAAAASRRRRLSR